MNEFSKLIYKKKLWVLMILNVVLFIILFKETLSRLWYEFQAPYTWDTTVYWAVARGLLNGLRPYVDLFDIKPPGIYLLSLFSLWLTNDVRGTFMIQIIAFFMFIFLPLPFLLHFKNRLYKTEFWLICLFLFNFCFLITLYVAERSGEFQIESLGAASLLIFLLTLFRSPHGNKNLPVNSLLASIGLLLAIGLKEPFLLTAFSVCLIFVKNFKELWTYYLFPLLIALVLGIILLFSTNLLVPYLTKYLQYVFSFHILRFSSPWQRGWNILYLFNDLNNFAFGLGYLILFILLFTLFLQLLTSQRKPIIFRLTIISFKFLLIIYSVSLAVGLGGEYYNHHFVFAVPVYVALFLYCVVKLIKLNKNWLSQVFILLSLLIVTFTVKNLPIFNYRQRINIIKHEEAIARAEAKYVDQVLDRSNMKEYLFIGPNGPQLYGFTHHSPQGPWFFQLSDFFINPRHQSELIDSLMVSDLVVVDNYPGGLIGDKLRQMVDVKFNLDPWPWVQDIKRETNKYQIYFRKNK